MPGNVEQNVIIIGLLHTMLVIFLDLKFTSIYYYIILSACMFVSWKFIFFSDTGRNIYSSLGVVTVRVYCCSQKYTKEEITSCKIYIGPHNFVSELVDVMYIVCTRRVGSIKIICRYFCDERN